MFNHFAQVRRIVGWSQAIQWVVASRIRPGKRMRFRISPDVRTGGGSDESVWVRADSTDIWVFEQIFKQEEYAPLKDLEGVVSILDLGANCGMSSTYLLRAFPGARVVAVEPDEDNFGLLRCNLERFKDRATCVRGAVWNTCCSLRISNSTFRGGGASARQVGPVRSGDETLVSGYDVPALMAMAGFERVSLLKVDIEGAEVMLFDESSASWIDRIDNIAIELHDDSSFGMASPVFWRAIQDRGFHCSRSGELVLCVRCRSA